MKKLITLSPKQAELMEELLAKTYQKNASALFVNLMVFYKEQTTRTVL